MSACSAANTIVRSDETVDPLFRRVNGGTWRTREEQTRTELADQLIELSQDELDLVAGASGDGTDIKGVGKSWVY